MNQLDESFAIMEKILSSQQMEMHQFTRKFFKLTLDQFKNSAGNYNGADKELLIKFKNLDDKIKNENQLNDIDLYELGTEYRWTADKEVNKP